MIEIEVQNETHQTQDLLRFATVPRIGEGLRLREPDGCWASYDVLDVWYQKAEFGDVWVPYLHVCITSSEAAAPAPVTVPQRATTLVTPVTPVTLAQRPVEVPVYASLVAGQENR